MSPQIIAAFTSLVISSLVTLWVYRKRLSLEYHLSLQTARLLDYRKLWALTAPLGWYNREPLTQATAQTLHDKLDTWYFHDGNGILLSENSLNALETLLEELEIYQDTQDPKKIRNLETTLRYALIEDIEGRNHPLISRRKSRRRELNA